MCYARATMLSCSNSSSHSGQEPPSLWVRFNLQSRIEEWAKKYNIELKPVHRASLKPVTPPSKTFVSVEDLESAMSRAGSLVAYIKVLRTFLKQTKDPMILEWIVSRTHMDVGNGLEDKERQFLLLLIIYIINVVECGEKLEIKSEKEIISFGEEIALEQAISGKCMQDIEDFVRQVLLPINTPLANTLIEILGGQVSDHYSEASSPLKSTQKRGRKFSLPNFERDSSPENSPVLRRLSDKQIMLKRVLDNRVISMDSLRTIKPTTAVKAADVSIKEPKKSVFSFKKIKKINSNSDNSIKISDRPSLLDLSQT